MLRVAVTFGVWRKNMKSNKEEIERFEYEYALELAIEFDVPLNDEQRKLPGEALFDYVATTILMRGDQTSVELLKRMRIALDGDTRCTIVHS
jgi:hypothetical protein